MGKPRLWPVPRDGARRPELLKVESRSKGQSLGMPAVFDCSGPLFNPLPL